MGLSIVASVSSTTMLQVTYLDLSMFFDMSFAEIQHRNVLFFSVLCASMLFFGSIASERNCVRLLLAGLIFFTVSSGMSAVSASWESFLLFQSFLAISDGMIVPAQMVAIRTYVREDGLGRCFAWFGVALSGAAIASPGIAVWINKVSGWQTIFIVLAVVAAGSAAAIYFSLWSIRIRTRPSAYLTQLRQLRQLPCLGILLFFLAVFVPQLLAITIDGKLGITASSLVAIGLLVAFGLVERSASPRKKLMPTGMRSRKKYCVYVASGFFFMLGGNILGNILPSYAETLATYQDNMIAVMLTVPVIISLFFAELAGRAADRSTKRAVSWAGIVLAVAVGALPAALLVQSGWSLFYTVIVLTVIAIASEFISVGQQTGVMLSASPRSTGSAMSIYFVVKFSSGAIAGGIIAGFTSDISVSSLIFHANLCFALAAIAALLVAAFDSSAREPAGAVD